MSKGEDSTDNIGKITIQLDDLYKSDPTLDHLKRLEEDRKALLSVTDLSAAWGEPSIQERVEDMRLALGYTELQDAFKSHEDYMAVTSPLISALHEDNPQSLLEAFKLDTEPYLDPTYAETLKATDLFSETLKNVSHLGLAEVPDYAEEMKKTMALYDDNFGLGNKKLVELATNFESAAFKSSLALSESMATINERMSPTMSALDSINSIGRQAAKAVSIAPKMPWLDSIQKHQERMKSLVEPITKMQKSFEVPTIQERMIEIPRPEDSPHYKLNEKILNNSEEQIILLKQVSIYMSSQSEKLEFLNDMTAKQVKENKVTAEKQMEENRVVAEKEMAVNAKSARVATGIAMAGILLTLFVSVVSIWATLYVYGLQDQSDNKDHAEVIETLKANNLNGSLSELIEQLKIKNKNESELVKLKKENVKMKLELEAKKSK